MMNYFPIFFLAYCTMKIYSNFQSSNIPYQFKKAEKTSDIRNNKCPIPPTSAMPKGETWPGFKQRLILKHESVKGTASKTASLSKALFRPGIKMHFGSQIEKRDILVYTWCFNPSLSLLLSTASVLIF